MSTVSLATLFSLPALDDIKKNSIQEPLSTTPNNLDSVFLNVSSIIDLDGILDSILTKISAINLNSILDEILAMITIDVIYRIGYILFILMCLLGFGFILINVIEQFPAMSSFLRNHYAQFIRSQYYKQSMTKNETNFVQRINSLTSSLSESVTLISQMQAEIEARQSLVDKLLADSETYNKLIALKKDEVEAVAQVFRTELIHENKKATKRDLLFFVAGILLSLLIQFLFR